VISRLLQIELSCACAETAPNRATTRAVSHNWWRIFMFLSPVFVSVLVVGPNQLSLASRELSSGTCLLAFGRRVSETLVRMPYQIERSRTTPNKVCQGYPRNRLPLRDSPNVLPAGPSSSRDPSLQDSIEPICNAKLLVRSAKALLFMISAQMRQSTVER
jgi:hypothetical protein